MHDPKASKSRAKVKTERYLCVALTPETYAIPILDVREIQAYKAPTPVPNMPPHLRGVVNLHGAIVPLVDLRQRLGLPAEAYVRTTVVVFVRVDTSIAGLIVDQASRVLDIPVDHIVAPPELGGRADASFVKGLARMDDSLLVVLDTGRLLAGDRALAGAGTESADLENAI